MVTLKMSSTVFKIDEAAVPAGAAGRHDGPSSEQKSLSNISESSSGRAVRSSSGEIYHFGKNGVIIPYSAFVSLMEDDKFQDYLCHIKERVSPPVTIIDDDDDDDDDDDEVVVDQNKKKSQKKINDDEDDEDDEADDEYENTTKATKRRRAAAKKMLYEKRNKRAIVFESDEEEDRQLAAALDTHDASVAGTAAAVVVPSTPGISNDSQEVDDVEEEEVETPGPEEKTSVDVKKGSATKKRGSRK